MKSFYTLLFLGLLAGCTQPPTGSSASTSTTPPPAPAAAPFTSNVSDYWYQGKAELNTYALTQARYGELREGTASVVFVSEDFLTDEQVKNDNYDNPNSTPILKTNLIRRFTTGIYDYSVMTSVFTPTKTSEQPRTLKVTTSSQDWCGQSFTQLNMAGGDRYRAQLRSYFEREGDRTLDLAADFLEDEVFNRIRSGGELPTGTFDVIPSTTYLLLNHAPYETTEATVSLGAYSVDGEGAPSIRVGGEGFEGEQLQVYTLTYPALSRTLRVVFEAAPPHSIVGWTETYPSKGRELTTTARLTHQVLDDYWSHNSVADSMRRVELGL